MSIRLISPSEPVHTGARTRRSQPRSVLPPSAMNQHADLATRPGAAVQRVPPVEDALDVSPSVVLYIDKQCLVRDCVSEQLAIHLSEWLVEPLYSARELKCGGDWPRGSLVILQTHGESIRNADVAAEMMTIAEAAPGLPLALMSDLDDATQVTQAIRLGVRGYLPSSLPIREAMDAIRLVGHGGTYVPANVLAALSETKKASPLRLVDGEGDVVEFSERELQVLKQLQHGKQNKIIAYELNICVSTVKVHIRHIMKKLNAHNRTQVVLLTNKMINLASLVPAVLFLFAA